MTVAKAVLVPELAIAARTAVVTILAAYKALVHVMRGGVWCHDLATIEKQRPKLTVDNVLKHHASPTRPDAEYDKQQECNCGDDERCHDECCHNHDCGLHVRNHLRINSQLFRTL